MFAAMAEPSAKLPVDADGTRKIRMTADENGALSNKRAEPLALFLADGLSPGEAWPLVGGDNTSSSSLRYRSKIINFPAFKKRLEALLAEKAELEADPIFGQVKWQAAQLWRAARAAGDLTAATKAMEVSLKIADKMDLARGGGSAPAGGQKQAPVGAPLTDSPVTSRSVDDIRAALIGRGMNMATPPAGEA